jgi:hypothetical protein
MRIAPIYIEQVILRRIAVSKHATRIIFQTRLSDDVRNLEGEIAPGQVAAILHAIPQVQAKVAMHQGAVRSRVMTITVVLILTDAHPRIVPGLRQAGSDLHGLATETATFQAQTTGFVGTGQRIEMAMSELTVAYPYTPTPLSSKSMG